jgi:hypothetical protein
VLTASRTARFLWNLGCAIFGVANAGILKVGGFPLRGLCGKWFIVVFECVSIQGRIRGAF